MSKTKPKEINAYSFTGSIGINYLRSLVSSGDLSTVMSLYHENNLGIPAGLEWYCDRNGIKVPPLARHEEFLAKLWIITLDYLPYKDYLAKFANPAEVKATLKTLIDLGNPLLQCLMSIDKLSEYVIEKSRNVQVVTPTPAPRDIHKGFFWILEDMILELVQNAKLAKKNLNEEDITKAKRFPKIRMAHQIAELLLEYHRKPALYRDGLWVVLMGGILVATSETIGSEQIMKLLNEARNMTENEYERIGRYFGIRDYDADFKTLRKLLTKPNPEFKKIFGTF